MDISECPVHLYNIKQKIDMQRNNKIKVEEWHKEITVYYVCGPSGCGKSKWVRDWCIEHQIEEIEEIKCTNGYWNGIGDGHGVAVYDDFRDSHMSASEFINFIDYNVHNLNVKGGYVKNMYSTIIITSI